MPARKSSKPNGASKSDHKQEDGLEILRAEHQKVRQLIALLESPSKEAKSDETQATLRQLFSRWLQHARLEADVAFPMFEEADVDRELLHEAQLEADLILHLMSDLAGRPLNDELFHSITLVLLRLMSRLMELEEREPGGVFAKAKEAGVDVKALKQSLTDEMSQRGSDAEEPQIIPSPRYLRGGAWAPQPKENRTMRGYERERDERGRFVEDDDHRRSERSRGYQGRGRYDDDDGRGWHGDPRGHAEASRRGWDERRGGSRYDEDDDRRRNYRSRSSDYDDYDRRSRGHGGWYGDEERHSEASRRGWENPDHGPSGWYGDREGHSQASQRGWDNPDHGRSGWYGDPEGHSEASRRGWDERRPSSRYDDDDHRRRGGRRGD